MKEKIFFKNSEGIKISGIFEEPNKYKKQIVIVVHGHASSKDGRSATDISKKLTERNINSFRIDLDGCGESEGKFEELDGIIKIVDSSKGDIHIINSKNDAGKKLDGLGGIAAILRYKLNY